MHQNALKGGNRKRTDEGDHHEVLILCDAFEDVEFIIEPPAVDRVEDLGKDKRVEYEGLNDCVAVAPVQAEDRFAEEVEDEDDCNLVDRLPDDHLDHVSGEEPCTAGVRFPVQ